MTVKITQIVNSDQEAFIRVSNDSNSTETGTLTLASLCKKPDGTPFQQAWLTKPLKASIRGVKWSGEDMAKIEVKRNNETFLTAVANPIGELRFDGELGYAENTNESSDISFTITGGPAQMWVLLRKNNYHSFVEDANLGINDDPTKIDYDTTH